MGREVFWCLQPLFLRKPGLEPCRFKKVPGAVHFHFTVKIRVFDA
jgi:hypothetical protein